MAAGAQKCVVTRVVGHSPIPFRGSGFHSQRIAVDMAVFVNVMDVVADFVEDTPAIPAGASERLERPGLGLRECLSRRHSQDYTTL
jgi:hypothetical protein